jgi:hypothetical protein
VDLKETGCVRLDWFQLAQNAVVDFCEYCDGPSEFGEVRESIGKLSNFQLPKEGSVDLQSLLLS